MNPPQPDFAFKKEPFALVPQTEPEYRPPEPPVPKPEHPDLFQPMGEGRTTEQKAKDIFP